MPFSDSSNNPQKRLPVDGEIFAFEGCEAFVALPGHAVKGPIPWVFYAPTLPGLPDGCDALWMRPVLGRGIAVAGIDVGESCGNPEGRRLFSAFHGELVARGFLKKACLLARSRGGLMLYNWAAENPEAVACVAGIYPVCDLQSFPGLPAAAKAYGLSEEGMASLLTQHNPVDRLAPLAAAGVRIFHVHGDDDKVVPLDRNSQALVERYCQLGGQATLHIIKGGGHTYDPVFFQLPELIDFLVLHASTPGRAPSGTS